MSTELSEQKRDPIWNSLAAGAVSRYARKQWRTLLASKKFSETGSILELARLLAHKHGFAHTQYFAKQMEWAGRDLPEPKHQQSPLPPLPRYLSPWHRPLLVLLEEMPFSCRILDLGCAIPLLLYHLRRIGFVHLFGTEDSSRSPGLVAAAREFCALTQTPAKIFDAPLSSYEHIGEIEPAFDIVTSFGAPTVLHFPPAYRLLKDGGFLIAETYFCDVPREFRNRFEIMECLPELGFRLNGFSGAGAVCIFAKLPETAPVYGEGMERRHGIAAPFRGLRRTR